MPQTQNPNSDSVTGNWSSGPQFTRGIASAAFPKADGYSTYIDGCIRMPYNGVEAFGIGCRLKEVMKKIFLLGAGVNSTSGAEASPQHHEQHAKLISALGIRPGTPESVGRLLIAVTPPMPSGVPEVASRRVFKEGQNRWQEISVSCTGDTNSPRLRHGGPEVPYLRGPTEVIAFTTLTNRIDFMNKKLQRYERNVAYDAPVCCVFCGKMVESFGEDDDPKLAPCEHTLFIAHDEGYEYVSDRVVAQLRIKGFEVSIEDGRVEIEPPVDQEENASPEFVTDDLEFTDGLKVASYVGPPSGFGSYVGFAPV